MDENLCAIREGTALLVGLLRCGHCGKKLYVCYKTKNNPSAMYFCRGHRQIAPQKCLSFGSHLIDKCVVNELFVALEPGAVQAGFEAINTIESDNFEKIKIVRLEIQNAQYQVQHAFEQYDMVDPKNRLVADTLEERLNTRLAELKQVQEKLAELEQTQKKLTDAEKQSIIALSHDFKKIWDSEKTDPVLKKQLLRLFIREIMVSHNQNTSMLNLIIHWQGGVHTKVSVKKRKKPIGNKTDESLIETVRKLAGRIDDAEIARVMNLTNEKTPTGMRWNKDRVKNFRAKHQIKLQRKRSTEDSFSAERAACYLGISRRALIKLVQKGLIDTNQVMAFAPWEISREQLDSDPVQQAVNNLKMTGRLFENDESVWKQLSLFSKGPVE